MHYENENMWCIGVLKWWRKECIEMMLKDFTCEKYDDLFPKIFYLEK